MATPRPTVEQELEEARRQLELARAREETYEKLLFFHQQRGQQSSAAPRPKMKRGKQKLVTSLSVAPTYEYAYLQGHAPSPQENPAQPVPPEKDVDIILHSRGSELSDGAPVSTQGVVISQVPAAAAAANVDTCQTRSTCPGLPPPQDVNPASMSPRRVDDKSYPTSTTSLFDSRVLHQPLLSLTRTVCEALIEQVVDAEVPQVVRLSVRSTVALRNPTQRLEKESFSSISSGRLSLEKSGSEWAAAQVFEALFIGALHDEAHNAVLAALRDVAAAYTRDFREKKLVQLVFEDLLREMVLRVATEAFHESSRDDLLGFMIAEDVRKVIMDVLQEAEDVSALQRAAMERRSIASAAAGELIEPLLLERVCHLIATKGEPILISRHVGQMLDAHITNSLLQYALERGERERDLAAAPILSDAHRTLALTAMLEDMLLDLDKLLPSAIMTSGDWAGVSPSVPCESDEELVLD